jgi:FkbM family methyltransferase
MYKLLKNSIKNFCKIFNLDIRFITPYSSEQQIIKNLIKIKKIDVILDVGANIGQFAHSILQLGFDGEIICFEPTSSAHKNLELNFKKIQHVRVYPRCALGDSVKKTTIHISENSVSSSILNMNDEHLYHAPNSRYVNTENVDLITLDSFFKLNPKYKSNKLYLKIDTQGFEMNVLRGAEKSLKNISVIQLEASIAMLYDGQPSFVDIIKFLGHNEFSLWSIIPGFSDPLSGRLLQFDMLFYRK